MPQSKRITAAIALLPWWHLAAALSLTPWLIEKSLLSPLLRKTVHEIREYRRMIVAETVVSARTSPKTQTQKRATKKLP